MSTEGMQPDRTSKLRVPVAYIGWDVVLATFAAVIFLGFIAVENVPSGFWKVLGLQSTAGILGALALYASIRYRVPNLAVGGIATLAPVVAARVVGDEGSAVAMIVIGLVIGGLVGLLLVGLVIGLRIPAWGATLGMSGLLMALSLRLSDEPRFLGAARDGLIIDLGVPLFVVSAVAAIAIALATVFLPLDGRTGPRAGTASTAALTLRGSRTIIFQTGALLFSSILAASAGVLIALRLGLVDGRLGSDLTRPLAIVLLGAASLRGRGTGVVALVAAAVIVEISTTWWTIDGIGAPSDQLIIVGVLAMLGLVVGGILELVTDKPHRRAG